jgi:serine/threonine protein kinase
MTKPFTNETAPAVRHMTESDLVRFALADDYELIEELGRGGMAIVYRAREKALDREVAIKVLPSRLVIDEGFVERFQHEARTAAKLEHPSIVPIYRVGRAGPNGEIIYFVMKLLRGQSLSVVMTDRGKLEPHDVRRILMETAAALNYAAKQSVVHRDIKPDNIMLDSEGRCVITDFGIAKAPGGQQTTAGTSLGTPRYMSPEHAMGLTLDGRSDMYSLGVVAYQCLFGRAPFEAPEPFAVLYKHIHEPVPEPTLDNDEVRDLYPIIARMLAKKPEDRYQTGNDLIAALGGQASDPSLATTLAATSGLMAPTERMPTPKPWSLSRWRMLSRTRQTVWGGVAILAITTLFGSLMSLSVDEAPAPVVTGTPPVVAGPTVNATPSDAVPVATPVVKPSLRAAEILAYNKLRSNCPRRADTLAATKPVPYMVLVDSLASRPRADRMEVNYDVCGLDARSSFQVEFILNKLRQGGLGFTKQKPFAERDSGFVSSPRTRRKFSMYTRDMSPGDYRLDVIVIDRSQHATKASREFKITDK